MSTIPNTSETRFEEIVQRNRRRIEGIARTYGHQQSDDLLQEILLQIWRGLPKLRGDAYSDTWCYRVALNTAITWTRCVDRQVQATSPLDTEQVTGAADGHDPIKLLQLFMATLSNTDRAIVLMYLDDIGSSQMAEILGLTDGAIRVRIHRIKQKLSEWSAIDS